MVTVYPLAGYYVQGESTSIHDVTPERAAELVGAPHPAFSLTPPDEEATIPDPVHAGPSTEG